MLFFVGQILVQQGRLAIGCSTNESEKKLSVMFKPMPEQFMQRLSSDVQSTSETADIGGKHFRFRHLLSRALGVSASTVHRISNAAVVRFCVHTNAV